MATKNRSVQSTRAPLEAQQTVIRQVRSGPLPSPDELSGFERVAPGAAERIITMAEREQSHRMDVELMAQRADIRHRDTLTDGQQSNARAVFRSDIMGQLLGFAVCIACVAGVVWLGLNGQTGAAVALTVIPTAAVIQALRTRLAVKKP